MIRNLMIGMSLFALSTASAIAAPAATHHAKAKVVAQASPTTPAATPTAGKSGKKTAKHTPKAKGDNAKVGTKMGAKADGAPAGEKAPDATK